MKWMRNTGHFRIPSPVRPSVPPSPVRSPSLNTRNNPAPPASSGITDHGAARLAWTCPHGPTSTRSSSALTASRQAKTCSVSPCASWKSTINSCAPPPSAETALSSAAIHWSFTRNPPPTSSPRASNSICSMLWIVRPCCPCAPPTCANHGRKARISISTPFPIASASLPRSSSMATRKRMKPCFFIPIKGRAAERIFARVWIPSLPTCKSSSRNLLQGLWFRFPLDRAYRSGHRVAPAIRHRGL